MAKSLFAASYASGQSIAAGEAWRCAVSGRVEDDANFESANMVMGDDGTLRTPAVGLIANTLSGDLTIELYVNNRASGCKHTVSSGTGWGIDTSTAFNVWKGDQVRWEVTAEAGTGSATIIGLLVQFESNTEDNALTLLGCNSSGSSVMAGAGTTHYMNLMGERATVDSTESERQLPIILPGTIAAFSVTTGNNTRTTDSTATLRVEGSGGNNTLTIADTDDTSFLGSIADDSISVDDLVAIEFVLGADTGNLNIEKISAGLVNTSSLFALMASNPGGIALDTSETWYAPVGGALFFSATESDCQFEVPANCGGTITRSTAHIDSNGISAGTTFTLRIDGVDTALSFTVGSTATGDFEDTGSVSVTAGDLLSWKIETGGTGSTIRPEQLGIVMEITDTGGATADNVRTWFSYRGTNGTTLDCFPFGAEADKLLVAMLKVRGGGDSFTAPTGWTSPEGFSQGSHGAEIYYRVATGTTADLLSTEWTDSGTAHIQIQEFDVGGESSPFDDSAENTTYVGSATDSLNTGTATGSTSDGIAVAFITSYSSEQWTTDFDGSAITVPSGYGGFVLTTEAIGTEAWVGMASKTLSASGDETPNWSTSEAGGWSYAAIVIFKKASSGGVTINAGHQELFLTARPAELISGTTINAEIEELLLTAYPAEVQQGSTIEAGHQELELTSYSAQLGSEIEAGVESLVLTAYPVSFPNYGGFDVPGLEYTMPVNRLHFTLPDSRLHYTLDEEDS